MLVFEDRLDAGRHLVGKLDFLRGEDVVVLGLPRGGVPVAAEVAEALGAPLDVIVVRKLGVPFQPELAMGAIGEGGVRVVERAMVARARGHRRRARARSNAASARSSTTGSSGSGGAAAASTCAAGWRWWSTTGSPRARRRGRPARWPGAGRRRGSSWPSRSPRRTPWRTCREADEVVCMSSAARASGPSGSTTTTSRRPPTTRSSRCSEQAAAAVPRAAMRPGTARADTDEDVGRSPAGRGDGSRATCGCREGALGVVRVRARQRQQPAQPAQPLRRRRAPARPGSARCCSTC